MYKLLKSMGLSSVWKVFKTYSFAYANNFELGLLLLQDNKSFLPKKSSTELLLQQYCAS